LESNAPQDDFVPLRLERGICNQLYFAPDFCTEKQSHFQPTEFCAKYFAQNLTRAFKKIAGEEIGMTRRHAKTIYLSHTLL
jgi:hypothetical protein